MFISCDRNTSEQAMGSFFGPNGTRLDFCSHHGLEAAGWVPAGSIWITLNAEILENEPIVRETEREFRLKAYGIYQMDS